MDPKRRRLALTLIIPMMLALVAGRFLVRNLRLVDFLAIFATGAVFGVALKGMIDWSRGKK